MKHKNLEQVYSFRDFLNEVEPIRFREPFAETLGTFNQENVIPIKFLFLNREKRFTEEGWRRIRAHV